MLLDLYCLAQNRLGILERVIRSFVRRDSSDVLPDDDDRQKDKLEKGLCIPGDNALAAQLESWGQPDKGNDRKYAGAPHRANAVSDLDRQPIVNSCGRISIHVVGRLDQFVLVLQALKRARVRYVAIRRHGHSFSWVTESFHTDIRHIDWRQGPRAVARIAR